MDQGFLPVPLEALARKLGVSKALIYAYYPTQYDLVNGLLRHYMPDLARFQLAELELGGDIYKIAEQSALAYFEHVADIGPLLHILLSDFYAISQVDPGILTLQGQVFGRLARVVRASFGFDAVQSLATVRLLAALVEEAGTLSFRGFYARDMCREICLQLVAGGLDGVQTLKSPSVALPPVQSAAALRSRPRRSKSA